jgi:lipoprotein-releasing system permease protein
VPGAVAPSVKVQAIIRYASRDVGTSIIGIDPPREPRVSDLVNQMRQGTLASLYRATNAIILGERLGQKIGARVGSNMTVQTSEGARIDAQVVGFFHSGVRSVDESTAYTLVRTAQILARQTGLVNEIRVRVTDSMAAREVSSRIERETGYKSVSWQEAHEDLLNTFVVRNIIMYTIVGAILLVASFGTYNIISTITHEKARDIAILKSLGLSEGTVRTIFVPKDRFWLRRPYPRWAMCCAWRWARSRSKALWMHPILLAPCVAVALCVAMFSSFAAGYVPARRAARLHPVEIIRGAT